MSKISVKLLVYFIMLLCLFACDSDEKSEDEDNLADGDNNSESEIEDEVLPDGDEELISEEEPDLDAELMEEDLQEYSELPETETEDEPEQQCDEIFSLNTCDYPTCGGFAGIGCETGSCSLYQCTSDPTGICLPDDYQCTKTEADPLCGITALEGTKYVLARINNHCQLYFSKTCGFENKDCEGMESAFACENDSDCGSKPEEENEIVKAYCIDNKCTVTPCADSSCPNYRECVAEGFSCKYISGNECNSACVNDKLLLERNN